MAKRNRRSGGRVTPKRTRPRHWDDDAGASRAVAPPAPPRLLEILIGLSELVAIDYLEDDSVGVPDFAGWHDNVLDDMATGSMAPEMAELIAELFQSDAMLRNLEFDSQPPGWVRPAEVLRQAQVVRCMQAQDFAHETRMIFVGFQLPNGEEMGVVVMLEDLGGGYLRDSYAFEGGIDDVVATARTQPELQVAEVDEQQAKLDMLGVIERAQRTIPQPDSDTWIPHFLVVTRLVAAMAGPDVDDRDWEPVLDETGMNALADDFLLSSERKKLRQSDSQIHDAVGTILWLKLGYGTNDPYRYGPKFVLDFLTDLLTRKVAAPDSELLAIVDVLPRLVTWSHRLIAAPTELSSEVLMLIEDVAPETRAFISDSDFPGGASSFGGEELLALLDPSIDSETWWLHKLVGGREEYESLDAQPLPQLGLLDLSEVPESAHMAAIEIVGLVDKATAELFSDDEEIGIAAHRFALHLAEICPHVITKGKRETAAAAIVAIIASANRRWNVPKKSIGDAVGTSSSFTDRARTFANQAGFEYSAHWITAIGDPRFLTSHMRQRILDGNV